MLDHITEQMPSLQIICLLVKCSLLAAV